MRKISFHSETQSVFDAELLSYGYGCTSIRLRGIPLYILVFESTVQQSLLQTFETDFLNRMGIPIYPLNPSDLDSTREWFIPALFDPKSCELTESWFY